MGNFLGYKVTVCDARPVFATASRFPDADEVVVDWPHRYLEAEAEAGRIDARTVLCVLTHDPKFDVPLLEVALRLPEVAYVGAMGSRRTHEDRLDAAARGRADRGGARPAVQPDRPRPRRPDPGGDRGEHRRGDHRASAGAARASGSPTSRARSTTPTGRHVRTGRPARLARFGRRKSRNPCSEARPASTI